LIANQSTIDIAASGGGLKLSTLILFGNGDGTFQPAVPPPNLAAFSWQFTADLNNDGRADLVSSSSGQVAFGNSDGTFALVNEALNLPVVQVADVNGDSTPDLLVLTADATTPPQDTGVLLGNGDGTFGPLIKVLSGIPRMA
jgi:hypothetical protein